MVAAGVSLPRWLRVWSFSRVRRRVASPDIHLLGGRCDGGYWRRPRRPPYEGGSRLLGVSSGVAVPPPPLGQIRGRGGQG
jgi:hypothetical protein